MPGANPDSGEDAESGRRDSAYSHVLQGLGAHLAQLDLEGEHTQQEYVAGFDQRMIAAGHYSLPVGEEGVPRYCPSVAATESSMAVTRASRTTLGSWPPEYAPSMVSDSSQTRQSFSIRTSEAESVAKAGPIDEDGMLIGGPVKPLRCLFSFLACNETFSSVEEWHDHSKSHFRSRSPPERLLCAFPYCGWQSQKADGEDAWEDRRKHFLERHNVFAECHLPWKKDLALFQHLWKMHLIDSAQLQELRRFGQLDVETAAYTSTEGASRHRDREGRRPRNGASYAPRPH